MLAAARRRLLAAADPVAARLIEIALSKRTEPRDAIVAAREILNRAGVSAPQPAGNASTAANGQVLWDEFCAIYHRRVAVGEFAPNDVVCSQVESRFSPILENPQWQEN